MSYHLGSAADLAAQASAAQTPAPSADPFARLPASFASRPSGGSFGPAAAALAPSPRTLPLYILGGAALAAFLLLRKKGTKR